MVSQALSWILCQSAEGWSWASCSSNRGVIQESPLWLYTRTTKWNYEMLTEGFYYRKHLEISLSLTKLNTSCHVLPPAGLLQSVCLS